MDNIKFVQTESTQLYGAGASLGATSVQLTNLTDLLGATLAMTDFGVKGYGTIEPGTTGQEEAITFTGVTQNADGSATLTGVSNVLGKAPYTETSGLKITHAGGTTFVISNTAAFYNDLTGKNNDETITGIYTFTSPNYPQIDVSATLPTLSAQFATKQYVDGVAIAGAPQATNTVYGISKLSVAAVSATQPIVVGNNDNRISPVSLASLTSNIVAALVGTGTPSSTDVYVNQSLLVGMIVPYAGSSAPSGWLLADGTAVSRTTYANLFAITSTTYGNGDGSTTFNLPNLKGKIPVGYDSAETEFNAVAKTGGEKTHQLIISEMPSHNHQVGASGSGTGYFNAYTPAPTSVASGNFTASTGGDGAHNNLQPYITVNYIIKY